MKIKSLIPSTFVNALIFTIFVDASSYFLKAETDVEKRYEAFEKLLTGSKLVGHFTILGRENSDMKKEEYTIETVKKLPENDLWLFKARVKYGTIDLSLPMTLEVKWAGDTPMITLSQSTLPGLGTFSARVIFYGDQYAGIWQHDKFGGQMFGEVKRAEK